MAARTLNPGVRKVEAWAWAMFDFANSGFTTVVITAVFNAYFVSVIAANAHWASLAWTAALAVSYALIMFTAPALGAYADLRLAKKRLLAFTTVGCALGTTALGLVGPGEVGLAVALVVVSNFFFGSGENLIAAFLPELARGRGLGRLSGWGWGLGYLGGMLTLGLCLGYVGYAQGRGLGADDYVPVTLYITAALFLVASLPTFIFLQERGTPSAIAPTAVAGSGTGFGGRLVDAYRQVSASLALARGFPDLLRFLVCIVFYQAGIQAVIALAAVYAQQAMHFDTRQSIQLVLVVNVMAALGALGFGHVQDRIGHKRAMTIALSGWLLTVVLAFAAVDAAGFWAAAGVAGLCLGAAQSAGRALVGYLSPRDQRAEFFGLWGLAVKLASILGPLTYGFAVWFSDGNHRLAMLSLGVYFVLGLAVLAGVNIRRGRRLTLRRAAGAVISA